MKNIYTLILFAWATVFSSHSQTPQLWGTTAGYGPLSGTGAIVHINRDGTGYKTPETCNCGGQFIQGSLVQQGNGPLYGMAAYGGIYGGGIIFSFSSNTSSFTDLYDFGKDTISYPWGSPVLASNGLLYGIALSGGVAGNGVLFSFDPGLKIFTNLYSFQGFTNRETITSASLLQASNGLLYGLTPYGGTTSGVLFSYNIQTSTYSEVGDLGNPLCDGCLIGGLTAGRGGLIYGITTGGVDSAGEIFSYNTATSSFKAIYSFHPDSSGGAYPSANIVQASDGLLYGGVTTGGAYGYGGIFSYNPATSTEQLIFGFDSLYDQVQGIMEASNGILYGTLGNNADGSIFSYNPLDSLFTTLYNFAANDSSGSSPVGNLLQASNGMLYGMTEAGGKGNVGVIFDINLTDSSYQNLYSMAQGINSACGLGTSLMRASNGLIYATCAGGDYRQGAIYSYNLTDSTYTNLFSFNGDNGSSPVGKLVQATNGLLYGVTRYGGVNNDGVLYSLNPETFAFTALFNFGVNDSSGEGPLDGLILGSDSLLYGLAAQGAWNYSYKGTIFSYTPFTSTFRTLYNFNNDTSGGYYPQGHLVQANNGLLYGTTFYGGAAQWGNIFSFDPVSLKFQNLHNFTDSSIYGIRPSGSLIQATDGLLYGLVSGGANGASLIYTVNPVTNEYKNLFSLPHGVYNAPWHDGDFIQASDGLLYATTAYGGDENVGVIFSFDPATLTYTNLFSFSNSTAHTPIDDLLEIDFSAACNNVYTNIFDSICNTDSLLFNGLYIHLQGVYYDSITLTSGCDSIIILNLTVTPAAMSFDTQTICQGQSYPYKGQILTQAGTYVDTTQTPGGCDSIVSLRLNIDAFTDSIIAYMPCAPLNNGRYFSCQDVGIFAPLFSDSVSSWYWTVGDTTLGQLDTLFISWGLEPTINYLANLDSTYAVCLTATASCGTVSFCDSFSLYSLVGITRVSANSAISIYPNPASDQLYIKTQGIQAQTIIIYDAEGRAISTMPFKPVLDVSKLSGGMYLLEVQSLNSISRQRFVVLK